MRITLTQDVIAGLVVGTIFLGAMATSRLFRSLLLTAAAAGLVFVYSRLGIPGLLKLWGIISSDWMRHQEFGFGFAAGTLLALAVTRSVYARKR